jgi:hypothetical protein
VVSEVTFDSYVKHFRAFFQHFVDSKVLGENPASRIEWRGDGVAEVGVLTVSETAQLFHTCRTLERFQPIIGRIAMEAFVGLRFGSGCRLSKADINFADKGVVLPAAKIKTKLEITPESCWSVTPRTYMKLKSELFGAAGVPHPQNCLRHGFATYHVAAFKNPGLTAVILCHTNQEQLFEHYKGRATEADGRLYQTISPATAKRLAGTQAQRDALRRSLA